MVRSFLIAGILHKTQIAVLTILSKIVNGGCFFITKKVECIYKKYTEAERRE